MVPLNNILLLGLAYLATNILTVNGDCLDKTGQKDFDFPKFAVNWTFGYLSKQAADDFTNWKLQYGTFDRATKSGQLGICTTEVKSGKYTIVSTDYDCYGVVVGCAKALNYPVLIIQFRDEFPDEECVKTAKNAYISAGLNFDQVQADSDVIKE
ncbi:hypothetical protein C0J52_17480 [Blattella germanica]|nr:hypothetical protein C0J52_17480 [Blattella germanica]